MDPFMEERVLQLRELKKRAALGGGEKRIAKLHEKGKLTARERLDRLLDPGSFVELQGLIGHAAGGAGDGVVVGHGTIEGRVVCVYSQDPTVLGGSIGPLHGNKLYKTVERALEMKVPFIGLNDSPGGRVERLKEGTTLGGSHPEKGGGSIFFPNTQASGVIPQISAILGSCGGISVYSPALTDFIIMLDKTSQMFITGPKIVQSVTGEELSLEQLGGAKIHCQVSGVADMRLKTEDDIFKTIRKLMSFLPSNCDESSPRVETGDDPERFDDEIADIVPSNPFKAYDVHKVISRIVDNGDFLEIKPEFAGEIVTGFGRLDGYTVGIVANQSMVRAGSMTIDSSDKQARFIRFCDCFNIPLVLLIDTPAYQPGSYQEHGGIIRHGAKVLYALCEAAVPRVCVILRKAYGGGNLGMGAAPGMTSDFVYYWPTTEVGVMGAKQSVELLYGEEIAKSDDPDALREEKLKIYTDTYSNPLYDISGNPHIQDILEPRETRRILIKSLRLLRNKQVFRQPKRHGNIPL